MTTSHATGTTADGDAKGTDTDVDGVDRDAMEELEHALDGLRGRIDELLVRVDLAGLDVREAVQKSLEVSENVYLAARSRLSQSGHDAAAGMEQVHGTVAKLLDDLRLALEDAEAVVRRSCGE